MTPFARQAWLTDSYMLLLLILFASFCACTASPTLQAKLAHCRSSRNVSQVHSPYLLSTDRPRESSRFSFRVAQPHERTADTMRSLEFCQNRVGKRFGVGLATEGRRCGFQLHPMSRSTQREARAADSPCPMCSSISAAESISPDGLARPLPAMSGAVP